MLTGEAKKQYQRGYMRDYMRKHRPSSKLAVQDAPQSKVKTLPDVKTHPEQVKTPDVVKTLQVVNPDHDINCQCLYCRSMRQG